MKLKTQRKIVEMINYFDVEAEDLEKLCLILAEKIARNLTHGYWQGIQSYFIEKIANKRMSRKISYLYKEFKGIDFSNKKDENL